jgi:microcystin-dependent protein
MTSPSNFLAAFGELSSSVSGLLYYDATTSSFSTGTFTIPQSSVSGLSTTYAPINSPAFTGLPTAPTVISTDNSQTLATTAFVQGLIAQALLSAVPTGTIVAFAGTVAPTGWALCANVQTVISIPTSSSAFYNLFLTIGGKWGGNGTTTWAMPYFPVGYAAISGTSTSVGTTTIGQNLSHNHPPLNGSQFITSPGTWNGIAPGAYATYNGGATTGNSGGPINAAAGSYTSFIVKL